MEKQVFPITRGEAKKQGIAFSSENNKNTLFPSRLRDLRDEKKVSQAVLAETLKVSKSTVGLWEAGETLPDAKALHDMAIYFGVSADYMLGLSKIPNTDINIRAVCEFLGFSEQSLHYLLFLKGSYYDRVRELLFSSDVFPDLLWSLDNFMRETEKVKGELNKKNPDPFSLGFDYEGARSYRFEMIEAFAKIIDRATGYKHMKAVLERFEKTGEIDDGEYPED